jgi:hypothetical protein
MLAINVDISGAVLDLNNIERSQLPYAAARALTKTVQDAQYAVRKKMFSVFTIRNAWTQQNVRITPAKKTNLYAEVYADTSNKKAPNYLNLQEFGGEKIAHGGHKYIAIPIRENLGLGPASVIPKRLQPSRLKKSFIVTLKDGRKFIFIRTASHGRTNILPVYRLIPEAMVKGVLDMEGTVLKVVQERFYPNFKDMLAEAVTTAR